MQTDGSDPSVYPTTAPTCTMASSRSNGSTIAAFPVTMGGNIRFRDTLPSAGGTFSKVKSAAQSISMSGQKQGKDNAKQLSLRSQPSALRVNRRRVYPTLWPKWGFLGTLLQEWERGTWRRSYSTYRMSLL